MTIGGLGALRPTIEAYEVPHEGDVTFEKTNRQIAEAARLRMGELTESIKHREEVIAKAVNESGADIALDKILAAARESYLQRSFYHNVALTNPALREALALVFEEDRLAVIRLFAVHLEAESDVRSMLLAAPVVNRFFNPYDRTLVDAWVRRLGAPRRRIQEPMAMRQYRPEAAFIGPAGGTPGGSPARELALAEALQALEQSEQDGPDFASLF